MKFPHPSEAAAAYSEHFQIPFAKYILTSPVLSAN